MTEAKRNDCLGKIGDWCNLWKSARMRRMVGRRPKYSFIQHSALGTQMYVCIEYTQIHTHDYFYTGTWNHHINCPDDRHYHGKVQVDLAGGPSNRSFNVRPHRGVSAMEIIQCQMAICRCWHLHTECAFKGAAYDHDHRIHVMTMILTINNI